MFKGKRLQLIGTLMTVGGILAAAFMLFALNRLDRVEQDITATLHERYEAYLLADELRQSSDDLTRLARTYVITADPAYEAQYTDILAIRNGEKERPADYHRIYWDFVAAGRPASPGSGVTKPLADLMREAGFTDAEFEFLAQAQANSDGLVGLEVRAMNAVKGIYADASGNYVLRGEPDMALAARLLHSPEYHAFKADIMAPVDAFFAAMEARFQDRLDALDAAENRAKAGAFAASVLLVATMTSISVSLAFFILRPLGRLSRTMAEVAEGREAGAVPETGRTDEIVVLARAIDASILRAAENSRLVGEVRRCVGAARAGDFSVQAQVEGQHDETRQIETALNGLFADLDRAFNAIAQAMAAIAAGDLTRIVDAALPGRLGEVLRQAEAARRALAEIVAATRDGAAHLRDGADRMSGQMDQLARRTEQSAAALEESAAALTELSSSVSSAATQAREADGLMAGARGTAGTANGVVQQVVAAMAEIQKSSVEIASIVSMIDGIAFQTNLLALNAGVEAARAGEAGRGFAVVASEVRALATRASEAASKIGSLIGSARDEVARGVDLADRAGASIGEISGAIDQAAELVTDISGAMGQQSIGIAEITRAVQELDQSTQQNAAMVQDSMQSTSDLLGSAQTLQETVSRFRVEAGSASSAPSRASIRRVA